MSIIYISTFVSISFESTLLQLNFLFLPQNSFLQSLIFSKLISLMLSGEAFKLSIGSRLVFFVDKSISLFPFIVILSKLLLK